MATSIDSFNDLKELGIDCEDDDSLTQAFNKAANHLQTLLPNLDNQTLLTLYAYYKQGSQGPCNTQKPSWYDMKAKSKWEAWSKLQDMPRNQAKTIYIETIKNLDPNFDASSPKESWVTVSTLQSDHSTRHTGEKTVFDFVKEEDSLQVRKVLESLDGKKMVDEVDGDGLGLIHWAADRGSVEILKVLIGFGVDVNLQDCDGQTALHYASSCGHLDCVRLLLENKARRDVVDHEGCSPESVACDATVKELLASFT